MLEISELKEKKLPDLQDLAKELGVPKYRTLKKLDLVYQILDYQAANPTAVKTIPMIQPMRRPPKMGKDDKIIGPTKNANRGIKKRRKSATSQMEPQKRIRRSKSPNTPVNSKDKDKDNVKIKIKIQIQIQTKIQIHRTIKTKNQVMNKTVETACQKTTTTTKTTITPAREIITRTNVLIIKTKTTAIAIPEIVTENRITNSMGL
jgi:transcription termination factor Rho